MALPTSGPISFLMIKNEFGAATPIIGRRWVPGTCVALSDAQTGNNPSNYNPSGIPNPGKRWATGPVANGVRSLMVRYHWKELDNGDGTFDFSRTDHEIDQCSKFPADIDGVVGVKLYMLIVSRTFTGFSLDTPFRLSGVTITGSSGQFHCSSASTTLTTDMSIAIQGSFGGSGSIINYANPTLYDISATNGSTTFTLKNRDGSVLNTSSGTPTGLTYLVTDPRCPMPFDLQYPKLYAETFSAAGQGWQGWRWSPTVLGRFNDLCVALGQRYDGNAFFGGIGTQETSTGGASGGSGLDAYTADHFVAGLKSESNSISNACPHGRHMSYTNFINGPFNGTYTSQTACLEAVATTVQGNGGVWGGPDLVVQGSIITTCYPTYNKVHNGTSPIAGKGATFCCIQPAEWGQDISPATPSNPQTVADLFDFGTGVRRDYGNGIQTPPLNLQMIVPDWETSNDGYNGQKFNPQWVNVMAANPVPWDNFTPE